MDKRTVEERVASGLEHDSSLNGDILKSIIIMLDPEKEKGIQNMMAYGSQVKIVFRLTQNETGKYMMAYLRG